MDKYILVLGWIFGSIIIPRSMMCVPFSSFLTRFIRCLYTLKSYKNFEGKEGLKHSTIDLDMIYAAGNKNKNKKVMVEDIFNPKRS